jgi:hypothetical protein
LPHSLGVQLIYDLIFEDKTSEHKGYQTISLSASNISSSASTPLAADQAPSTPSAASPAPPAPSNAIDDRPSAELLALVERLYAEATNQLTKQIAGVVTDKGIETPLGVLSSAQIDKGEELLNQIEQQLLASKSASSTTSDISYDLLLDASSSAAIVKYVWKRV